MSRPRGSSNNGNGPEWTNPHPLQWHGEKVKQNPHHHQQHPPGFGGGITTGGGRPHKRRAHSTFSVPIPSVPQKLFQYARRMLGYKDDSDDTKNKDDDDVDDKNNSDKEDNQRERHRAAMASAREDIAAQQAEAIRPYEERLRALEVAKSEGLLQIRQGREAQLNDALREIEDKLKTEYAREQQERERLFREECEKWKKEQEAKIMQEDEFDEDEEPPAKRAKLEETTEKDAAGAGVDGKGSEAQTDQDKPKEHGESETKERTELLSERKARELKQLEDQLQDLAETKKEMAWLLKEVIKAEHKQKGDSKEDKMA